MFDNHAIYLVDSDAAYRRRLALDLRNQGMEIRTFVSERELIQAVEGLPAGCILLAIRTQEPGDQDVIRTLLARRSDMPIIVMRVEPSIQEAVQALRIGAVDCLAIPCSMPKMRAALDYAFQLLPTKIADRESVAEAIGLRAHLTRREEDVLRGIVAGMTNRAIAQHLSIGVRTVEMHRANMMQKLRVDNLASLLRFAALAGIMISGEDAA
ncbi:response regulator transcription factor [Novosphingobium terrae]|uniref:response regulator transcription factor n=1 Tax=Novosphingobium terrae TaxID=2726189 RepID=UPI0019802D28|nr:LuxR C-terminal-related transcriptional regulator [Novosphingobium terrae]